MASHTDGGRASPQEGRQETSEGGWHLQLEQAQPQPVVIQLVKGLPDVTAEQVAVVRLVHCMSASLVDQGKGPPRATASGRESDRFDVFVKTLKGAVPLLTVFTELGTVNTAARTGSQQPICMLKYFLHVV